MNGRKISHETNFWRKTKKSNMRIYICYCLAVYRTSFILVSVLFLLTITTCDVGSHKSTCMTGLHYIGDTIYSCSTETRYLWKIILRNKDATFVKYCASFHRNLSRRNIVCFLLFLQSHIVPSPLACCPTIITALTCAAPCARGLWSSRWAAVLSSSCG